MPSARQTREQQAFGCDLEYFRISALLEDSLFVNLSDGFKIHSEHHHLYQQSRFVHLP